MQNKPKLNTTLSFVAVIGFLGLAFLGGIFQNKFSKENVQVREEQQELENIPDGFDFQSDSSVLGKKEDLIYFSIWPGTEVSGIRSYRGAIKGAWFFEGNILINILDKDKNLLRASNAVATTDWMTAEWVDFEGNIDFTGLPKGPAYFEIHNDNASGLPEHDKSIQIPIVIK